MNKITAVLSKLQSFKNKISIILNIAKYLKNMPEESKKTQHQKGRNDVKEQRKPRQARHQEASHDKKHEKKAEETKVPVPQKPVYDDPGPEFYKNLKRETDEILKITEEANSKYKKKEIQSNWAKYEMPIESYDEYEEQENMGADYEKLIEAPLSVGGHFQFKHEKSWDADTGPSPYDKYFEINMDNLFLSISTVPFHERINIDKSIFSESDILSMNNRATRYKQKYYNDKTYTTPELKVQDSILSSLAENNNKIDYNETKDVKELDVKDNIEVLEQTSSSQASTKQDLEINETKVTDDNTNIELEFETLKVTIPQLKELSTCKEDDLISGDTIMNPQDLVIENIEIPDLREATTEKQPNQDVQKNPTIESPEDLEKWLDDFLDG